MANEKLNLIVLAGLLHDIGKLFERGEIFKKEREKHWDLCPKAGKGGYLHAAHTAAFCDWLEDKFDCLKNTECKDWKTWSAAHHRDDKTQGQASVIRISDKLSSSERNEADFYQRDIHRRTLLEPVLERAVLDGYDDCLATGYRYLPVRLTAERESLFPVKGEDISLGNYSLGLKKMPGAERAIPDPGTWTHMVADKPDTIIEAYRKMGEELLTEIQALSEQCRKDLILNDLIVCLTTLLERYTANIPSATNVRHPDISLFDHLRTTAAIAQAFWLYLKNKGDGTLTELPGDDASDPCWLLACGDFSGIQKFIYNLTNKGAARGLRGRSFYVGHFCNICADYILRELELTHAALLYNSGGKFYLLIPAHMRKQLYKVRAKINEMLLNEFKGEVFFGLGLAEITADMFEQGKMHKAWENAADDLEQDRMRKFKAQLLDKSDFFNPQADGDPTEHCRVCGSSRKLEKITRKNETIHLCISCREMEQLGQVIADTEAIVTLWDKDKGYELANELGLDKYRVFSVRRLNVCYLMVPEKFIMLLAGKKIPGECIFLNKRADQSFGDLPLPCCSVSTMYLGKWDISRQSELDKDGKPVLDKDGKPVPWEFDDYAENSRGIERMGILRMDVDNLGMVFFRGLNFPTRNSVMSDGKENPGWGDAVRDESGRIVQKHMASISRMVTLSRQLNHFFSGYLPKLLEQKQFDKCQIIYAGGDDLFIIGSWDQLPNFAKNIHSEFREFCCMNPLFSISGGLTLQRGKYPIYKGAQLAGEAEKKAKAHRKSWSIGKNSLQKDSFCFLDVPIVWEDMKLAEQIKQMLETDMDKNKDAEQIDKRLKADMDKNRGLMSFLSQTTANNKTLVQKIVRQKQVSVASAWEEIEYMSWRWRTSYQLRRRYKDDNIRRIWADVLFANKFKEYRAKLPVYTWLELPLRWTDFLHREKGGK
ncbi:MAG: type III-A CRISPR-associated protein Cas10/Csm1 [Desulfobacterales bacterium]|nr:type III-A CRISPR-associated protein Cas10/Csm1 [Desulfobacterales bacterium]